MTESTTPQLTESEVAEIEARANAATLGPWVYFGEPQDNVFWGEIRSAAEDGHFDHIADTPELDERDNDMEFIAHARADIPALIQDWRALRTACDALGKSLKEFCAANGEAVGQVRVLTGENAALREQLAYVTASLKELRGLRDKWLTLLNPTSTDETVEGAIRNLQQAYVSEHDNATELQSQLAQVTSERDEARTENERLALQLKTWQEEKDTKAG